MQTMQRLTILPHYQDIENDILGEQRFFEDITEGFVQ
jgi:hypothetical protein